MNKGRTAMRTQGLGLGMQTGVRYPSAPPIANPSGETIQPAMGERSEPASATGGPPVDAGSSHPFFQKTKQRTPRHMTLHPIARCMIDAGLSHTKQRTPDMNASAAKIMAEHDKTMAMLDAATQQRAGVTDARLKDATIEYLSHRGERPYRVLRGGQELWECHVPAMQAAFRAAAVDPSITVTDEANADGALIAAASDMLAALKAMLDHYGPPASVADMCDYDHGHPISLARAAISKATGS